MKCVCVCVHVSSECFLLLYFVRHVCDQHVMYLRLNILCVAQHVANVYLLTINQCLLLCSIISSPRVESLDFFAGIDDEYCYVSRSMNADNSYLKPKGASSSSNPFPHSKKFNSFSRWSCPPKPLEISSQCWPQLSNKPKSQATNWIPQMHIAPSRWSGENN